MDARALAGQAHDARQLPLDAGAEYLQRAVPVSASSHRRSRPWRRPTSPRQRGDAAARALSAASLARAPLGACRCRSTRCSRARSASSTSASKASPATSPPMAQPLSRWTGSRRGGSFALLDQKIEAGQPRGAASDPCGGAGAHRRAPRRRADPRARRAPPGAARRAAHRMGAHVRAAARRDLRRAVFEGWAPTWRPRKSSQPRVRSSSRPTTTSAPSAR